jgi:acyl-CoA synthetase (AMP-forming)/AMP-acid ligase II
MDGVGTVPAALARAADLFGADEAMADGDVRLSFAELHEQVRTAARFFVAAGVQPGDRVAVWSPNTWHWPVAALGAQYAGATLVPINTRYTGHEALDILTRTHAKALVVAGEFLGVDRLRLLHGAAGPGGLPDLRVVLRVPVEGEGKSEEGVVEWGAVGAHAGTVPVSEIDARVAAVGPEDVSDILFTSGTTGRSKGVCTAHRQVIAVAESWAQHARVTREDRYLIINPFFHSFGYKAGIVVCLLTGATIGPQAVYDVEAAMALIAAERCSVLPGAPTIYQTMLDHPRRGEVDLSSLRCAVTGAAVVPVALVERMQAELNLQVVLTAYGLTEAVVATMCRPEDDPVTIATTSGRATAGFEVRIAGSGEILLRGPNTMLGYLDDPEATAAAIDGDGWLHTGDVGTLDERGYLRITDRLKDMYICGGFNVYPAEVEQALVRLDGVAETAVIGVPDERLGEVGRAFVVRRPGAALTGEDVIAFARERVANFKVPRSVAFVDALPRNASGKVLKTELRGQHE